MCLSCLSFFLFIISTNGGANSSFIIDEEFSLDPLEFFNDECEAIFFDSRVKSEEKVKSVVFSENPLFLSISVDVDFVLHSSPLSSRFSIDISLFWDSICSLDSKKAIFSKFQSAPLPSSSSDLLLLYLV